MDSEQEEKEHAGEYEIMQSVIVGRKRFVMGYCEGKPEPYMIANHIYKFDGMFDEYYDIGVSDDYMEVLAAFIQRQKDEYDTIIQQRTLRKSDGIPYTVEDCLPGFKNQNIVHQVVVMKAKTLNPEFRVKEEQLFYALNGNGCEPDARGTKVFGKDCYTGEKYYVRRYDIEGVIKPELIPQWAKDSVERFKKEERECARKLNMKKGEER